MRSSAVWVAAVVALTASGCGSNGDAPGFELLSGAGGATGATSSSSASSSSHPSTSSGSPERPGLGPPYPIVLAHGFFGFEEFAGLDFATYFYRVKDHLATHGEALVFTPATDPFNDSTTRGAQLAAHVAAILEQTGSAKVNLIGHSQGGLDARVVAHDHPDWVASVISLETPHLGTPIADIAMGTLDDPNLQGVLDFLLQAAGKALYDQVNDQTSLAKPMELFSEPGIAAFNQSYPDQPGVYYASIAGRSDWHSGGSDCSSAASPGFVAGWSGELDPIDPLFDLTEMLLDGGLGNPYPNDGLVRVKDAKHGVFLGCIPADHLDMVGHLFGDGPGLGNDWGYLEFYAALIGFIREQGF